MALAEEVSNQLETKVNNDKKTKLSDLYVGRYKRGAVLREQIFKAESSEHAFVLFTRYINMLRAQENNRCSMIGVPQPMALDIEKQLDQFYKETGRQL